MSRQTTLLTSHKGVDLHAASALLVMKERLEGGHRLANLLRCELHAFWDENETRGWEKLFNTGRYYNPNKHHYGHFLNSEAREPWFDRQPCRGEDLAAGWLGKLAGTDLKGDGLCAASLYNILLGGAAQEGLTTVDVLSFPLGQEGPVLSGTLWRLLISGDPASAVEVGRNLAVARSRKQGLLINPHMEAWLMAGTER